MKSRTPNPLDAEDQAAKWLVRLDLDRSRAVRAEFRRWIASAPKNYAVYLRLERSWRRADRLRNIKPLDGEVNENVLDTFPHALSPEVLAARAQKPKNALKLALAASVATVGLIGALWFAHVRSEWQVYKTDLGGFQRVALQDGSTALLNTNSEIRVHLTKERRLIELTRGEALFTVAHDSSRPFDVKAADTVVRAVGTAFSVRLGDERQVDVLVTEGRVAIDPPDDSQNMKLADRSILLPQLSTLNAGETVRVAARRVQEVKRVDTEVVNRKLAWTQGRLWFDRVTLAEAVAEFNRYNRRQLVIDDPEIAGLHIGGAFDATDLDSFVAALGTFGIHAIHSRTQADDPDTEVIRLAGNKKAH